MSERRYRFGPLEQRSAIGPLRAGQVAIVAVAALLGLGSLYALRSFAGMAVAIVLLSIATAVIFLPIGGRTAEEWAPVVARWLLRSHRSGDGYRSGAPSAGVRIAEDGEQTYAPSLPPELGHIASLRESNRGQAVALIAPRAGEIDGPMPSHSL